MYYNTKCVPIFHLISCDSQVRPDTSNRRERLIEIATRYATDHPSEKYAVDRTRLDAQQWRNLVMESRFTISPAGRSPETFRLWEALEAG